MQAATATNPPGSASDPPRAGDGFTFEHLADRPQLWLDFCADTGDGGDPTYAVARAMAAPGLKVSTLSFFSSFQVMSSLTMHLAFAPSSSTMRTVSALCLAAVSDESLLGMISPAFFMLPS